MFILKKDGIKIRRLDKMCLISANIGGYKICKEGTWCEVTKKGHHLFAGNVSPNMTIEEIYQEIKKEVVFSINGKEVRAYDYINEFEGKREAIVKQLATENNCNEKDVEVTIRKPKLDEKILKIKCIGIDSCDRPIYEDENGIIYKDVNLGKGKLNLCTSCNNDFWGEPNMPLNENIKIEVVKNFNKNKKGREAR